MCSMKIFLYHYNDVIMSAIASQITSLTVVYWTVYSGADKRKYQSSTSLAFVRRIHRRTVNSPHKWPVTRKMLPFDDVIMWNLISNVRWVSMYLVYCIVILPHVLWFKYIACMSPVGYVHALDDFMQKGWFFGFLVNRPNGSIGGIVRIEKSYNASHIMGVLYDTSPLHYS